ncbi:MAG: hypothetical protein M3Z03_06015 [Actinomycetota bacterium]|jgi:hypothetical protein|nr:hypothetical protein [Actinomycetota bacterium]
MDVMTWVRNQWDRVGAWVLVALGGLALVLGWVGVTGTPYTFEQIPFVISGGLGGLFLLGVGAMLWISADLRDEWRKLDRLLELHEERADLTTAEAGTNGHEDTAAAAPRRRRTPLRGQTG